MKRWLSLIFFALVLGSCARVGSPVGGARDTIAPKFVKANIDSTRINVPTDLRELRLEFNELITLRDISRNLTITPEIRRIKRILPSNLGNRYILIRWEEDLQPNTTYSFNFGNAIADLNEGNALPYFNFAFSTGPEIDNLYISGEVSDAMKGSGAEQRDPKSNIVVGLYPETAGRADFTKNLTTSPGPTQTGISNCLTLRRGGTEFWLSMMKIRIPLTMPARNRWHF